MPHLHIFRTPPGIVTPMPPWAAHADGKKCFPTSNLNLPWHNWKPFSFILLLLFGSRGQPQPRHDLPSGHCSWKIKGYSLARSQYKDWFGNERLIQLPRNLFTASTEMSCQRLAKTAQTKKMHFLRKKCQPIWFAWMARPFHKLFLYHLCGISPVPRETEPSSSTSCCLLSQELVRCWEEMTERALQKQKGHSIPKYQWQSFWNHIEIWCLWYKRIFQQRMLKLNLKTVIEQSIMLFKWNIAQEVSVSLVKQIPNVLLGSSIGHSITEDLPEISNYEVVFWDADDIQNYIRAKLRPPLLVPGGKQPVLI